MTVRLTVAQALVRFLANQYSERDGVEQRLIPGCWGIFGHGNVAGVGQALLEAAPTGELPYHLARNEQGMVHAAVGFARMRNRLQAMACTASIGPGSTNMLTGAALATTNRIPVLLLPSDIFATRVAAPVLQELELPGRVGHLGERRVPAAVAVLRPGVAPRAAAGRPAGGDAGVDRPGRDRSGDGGVAAGRAGRGPRLARGAVRRTGVAHPPPGARAGRAGPRGGGDPRRAGAAGHRRVVGCTTARRPPRCARSPRPPAYRWPTPRPARAPSCWDHPQAVGGVGSTGVAGGQRAGPRGRCGHRDRAPATRTSPPPRAPRSSTRTCGS